MSIRNVGLRQRQQLRHGASLLPRVRVNSYNAELRDEGGFLCDRANKRAFQARLDEWRSRVRKAGPDPFADVPTSELYQYKKDLQEVLLSGEAEAAGLLIGAIENYAHELARVVLRLLDHDGWQQTQRLAAGGGFREGRVGELAIGRASVLLKSMGAAIDIVPIRNDPDDAGLIGTIHLVPPELVSGYDGVLAVDIGGTNFRIGIIALDARAEADRGANRVLARQIWRHADERPTRDAAVANSRTCSEVCSNRRANKVPTWRPISGLRARGGSHRTVGSSAARRIFRQLGSARFQSADHSSGHACARIPLECGRCHAQRRRRPGIERIAVHA